jgi:NarL family two-component system response regulator LiaR
MFKQDSKTRVLIVDDVADVRQDLRVFLEVVGDFQVVGEARNGREAIEQARALHPDIVIMDLAMPVLDGYTAAARIKTDLAGCRIAALTVHCTEFDRLQAQAAGFDAFVVKGGPLLELLGAIRPLSDGTNRESDRM